MLIKIKNIIKIFAALLILSPINSFAQKITVPVEMQFQIIPKIISLDKNLKLIDESRESNILIVYSSQQRNSYQVYEDILKHISLQKLIINGKEPSILAFDISSQSDLRALIKENDIKILYITPLRGVNIPDITNICKEQSVLSVTGVEEYRNDNVSVILTMQANKLKININLQSAKNEGTNFSSRLLRVVTIL